MTVNFKAYYLINYYGAFIEKPISSYPKNSGFGCVFEFRIWNRVWISDVPDPRPKNPQSKPKPKSLIFRDRTPKNSSIFSESNCN